MKIGIDARFWNETGVGRYIRNLLNELHKIDHENEYVIFVQSQDLQQVRKMLGNNKWKVVSTDIHWHSVREQLELPKFLESYMLDIMHFPYFSVPIRYSRPYIVTIHDLILHHFATGEATTLPKPFYRMKLLGYKYIISKAATRACKIIAVSETTKNEITDHLHVSPEKVVVTYEGVDKALSGGASQDGKNKYGAYFLHVGNVYPHKNAKRLVDAFTRADLKETKLIFVGKKDFFMNELEKYAASKFHPENFIFLGFVEDTELAGLFHNSLATIIPSLMEGFGLPVLEAMANDSLVLASDIPSLREIAHDAVLYCDPFAIADISAKIRHIAESSHSEFRSKRKMGQEIVKEFKWSKMAEQTLILYESCASLRQS